MILGIDTTEREKICLALFDKENQKCFEFATKNQSADLVTLIDNILKKEKKSLKDIRAILVNQGPGSFTGVRVGVTVANTLAWTLNIPIYGYREGEREDVLAKVVKSPQTNFSKISLPYYEKILNPKP